MSKSQQKLELLFELFNQEFESMRTSKKTGQLSLEVNIRDGGLSTYSIIPKYGGQANAERIKDLITSI